MVRKRKPGGGRKPIYRKVSNFSTRITAELRDALEAEAAKSGQTISQVAAQLLLFGLEFKRISRKLDDPVRALGYVIDTIARFTKNSRDCDWRTDPSVFEVFRLALLTFLERLRPAGQIDTSVQGPLVGLSPEQYAETVSRLIWNFLQSRIEPRSLSKIEADMVRKGLPLTAEDIAAISPAIAVGEYDMLYVQRALGIKFEETKP